MNIYKFQQISISFHKYLPISLIFLILFLGTFLFFSQKNFSIIPQPTTKAQSSYPQCQQGRITSPCQCGNQIYNAGFCCYHPNANSGIWFDPSYEDIFSDGCPTGNFYFVDQNNPNASDENPGTEEEPWKTIEHAVQVVQAGDTILIKEGEYFVKSTGRRYIPALNPANSGSPGNYITITNYNGEEVVITYDPEISGPSGPESGPLIGVRNRSYIKWKGLKIVETAAGYHADTGPVIIWGSSSHIILDGLEVVGAYVGEEADNHSGIRIEGNVNDVIIQNCKIHNFDDSPEHVTPFNVCGILIYDLPTNVHIRNNEIYDNYVGVRVKDESEDIFIYKNVFHDNLYGWMAVANPATITNVRVYQNIFYNCTRPFEPGAHGEECSFYIYNNAIYNSNRFVVSWTAGGAAVHLEYYNNIAYILDSDSSRAINGWYNGVWLEFMDYNDWYDGEGVTIYFGTQTLDQWRSNPNDGYVDPNAPEQDPDVNSLTTDPLFVNPESHDFHLNPNSPCLNAGIDRQDYDNDGNTTEPINMGAYITDNETIGLIDLSQYIVEEPQPNSCASQNGVCCHENQICQNGTFISSSDCGNLCCTGECISPSIPGDLNQDNKVNSSDFQILIQKFKETQNIETEDLNSDGIVDIKDIGILMHYWTN